MTPLTYALLAQKAYNVAPQIGVESSSARAILETTDDGLTVAFPGTDNLACWLADLDVAVIQRAGLGGVHAGFLASLEEIENELLAYSPTITCGHSEGAALAILYAAVLCLQGRPPKAVYAFEPPRVSIDDTLAKLVAAHGVQMLLTQHGLDVVPMVPRLIHDWQHSAPLTLFGQPSEPIPNVPDHMIENVVRDAPGIIAEKI